MIIEGNISVKAALLNDKRQVKAIYIDQKKKDRDTSFIIAKAKEKGIEIKLVDREEIDQVSQGKTHGGLIAEVSERQYQTIEDILIKENPFLCLLEGIEDPFNLGYILRTLYSAGCDGVILRNRDWSHVESVILKSSAGAFDAISIVLVDDMSECVSLLKSKGIRFLAAMRKNAISYDEANYQGPICIAIGGEMRGLSSKVLKQIDENIYIPYANDFHNALNAAAATAVIAFEAMKQRR